MSQLPSASIDMPRNQIGPNPQHLLVTLFGDYWHGRSVAIPSAALVQLLGEFGVTAASARSTFSRLARRGIIELVRDGRSTSYRVRQDFLDAGEVRATRILGFGARLEDTKQWDGKLVLVAFSIKGDNRQDREALRVLLRTWGFGPVRDGLWASVRADVDEVGAALEAQGVDGVSAFSSRVLYPRTADALRGMVDWPIDRVRESYTEFLSQFGPQQDRAASGSVAPAEALILRTQVMDAWRSLVHADPDLPRELLPDDWPREDARELFVAVYDGLGPLAEIRCRQIVGAFDPDLIPSVSHLTAHTPTASDGPTLDR